MQFAELKTQKICFYIIPLFDHLFVCLSVAEHILSIHGANMCRSTTTDGYRDAAIIKLNQVNWQDAHARVDNMMRNEVIY